ncbi:M14 metallopeptidase family protein [Maribacter sp. X9]|uniref:M14 family metallopeptidase n=1 Tax=Maribacter sp. X9 TaxID=3402159 RepID=UPI003AF337BE
MEQSRVDYRKIYVSEIQGRYVTYNHLNDFISNLVTDFKVEDIGMSVRNNRIKSITYGQGSKRILMWSQMHGNESTTTKAVMDLLNYLQLNSADAQEIRNSCTLKIIPILNPDGASIYTRVNANKKDLNRDAQDLSQPESRILNRIYNDFQPDFCFNLHDQRTIFNVGTTNKPATVSFLAPAFDLDRNNSTTRKMSMQLIAAMNSVLQEIIPGQIGRYDDGFNPNCVGDAFQMKNTPTVLFESGHYPGDYQREKTRELIFYALLKAILTISKEIIGKYTIDQYLAIPENGKQYVDILIKNVKPINNGFNKGSSIFMQYKELLKEGKIHFQPEILHFDVMPNEIFGHKILDYNEEVDVRWLRENGILKLLS